MTPSSCTNYYRTIGTSRWYWPRIPSRRAPARAGPTGPAAPSPCAVGPAISRPQRQHGAAGRSRARILVAGRAGEWSANPRATLAACAKSALATATKARQAAACGGRGRAACAVSWSFFHHGDGSAGRTGRRAAAHHASILCPARLRRPGGPRAPRRAVPRPRSRSRRTSRIDWPEAGAGAGTGARPSRTWPRQARRVGTVASTGGRALDARHRGGERGRPNFTPAVTIPAEQRVGGRAALLETPP